MNSTDLPPLPPVGAISPDACAVVRLYMAVSHDLNPYQIRAVTGHLQICSDCAREQRLMSRSTQLVAGLEDSQPSARVDQAIMAAIAARSRNQAPVTPAFMRPATTYRRSSPRRVPVRLAGLVAAAAVFMIAAVSVLHFVLPSMGSTAFAVPTNVSWNSYVIYHSQTVANSKGQNYHVESYHNMATDDMNVETTMDGKLDIVAISDGHKTLGIDMRNHVAQWNADSWTTNDSIFDLAQLRKDLKSGKVTYLGKGQFQGQDVYRIRDDTGVVLLLDMQYKPVNVLQGTTGSDPAKPVYDKFQLLEPTKVDKSMWNMSVPANAKPGSLPVKP